MAAVTAARDVTRAISVRRELLERSAARAARDMRRGGGAADDTRRRSAARQQGVV